MVLHLEHILGFAQPFRPQMRPVGVFFAVFGEKRGLAADDGHDRTHSPLPQQRTGVDVVIIVAVVKGQHDRLFRERRTALRVGDKVLDRHGFVAALAQCVEVACQHLGRHDVFALPGAVLQDAVVHDDRERDALLGKHRLHPVLPQQSDAEAQRENRADDLRRRASKAVFQEKSPPRCLS